MQPESEAVLQLDLRPLDVGHGGEGLQHRVLRDNVQHSDVGADSDHLKDTKLCEIKSWLTQVDI